MSLSYHNPRKYPRNFRDMTNLAVEEFEPTVEKWKQNKKFHGRKSHVKTLEDKISFEDWQKL